MTRTTRTRRLAGLSAAIAGFALLGAAPAQAGDWQYSRYGVPVYKPGVNAGAAVAAGVVGGAVAGLALGGALAPPPPPRVYAPPIEPVYVSPPPPAIYAAPGPTCYPARQRIFVPGWGWQWQRTMVCDD